ncbi:MarR family transcriptional regulator [Enterococcus devriesei]|uniref:MarR family transcriptional regulator n=1 Tax=Enterococcus viikkiensis TaxID=930854 RepID=A0ABU3FNG1_9ENTE|nr:MULTISPECIES: MarR family transcriptional regulator [Enterococcus]MBU5363882.1 MarR family transcriptional regulator [Enterococcus devriesei]MDT2822135.1 MarR family transcriptional regulator [Enterococcus devriesei]MDT2827188.1 MarR family transcriptional regulator [Enterococcus viikkiensis]MDU6522474.1 MarR family transcriptional regulator [Enterococcus sp.]
MKTEIFEALIQIVNFFNDPRHDTNLLKKAGIKDDKNLLPIIVRVGVSQTISIGQLAKQLGKNHSSTSRQIDKFEQQGLLLSAYNLEDQRIREVSLTEQGKALFQLIEKTRYELFDELFRQIDEDKMSQIADSLTTLAEALKRADQS